VARSRAWQTFLSARTELRQLTKTAESQSDELLLGRRLSDQENQLRLVVVGLVGQFQAYIAELMDELCDTLPEEWEQLAPFQKRYVTVQLRRRLEWVLGQYSEVDLGEERKLEQFKNAISACSEWPQKPATLRSSSSKEEVYGFLRDNSSKSLDRAISQFRPDGMKFSDWLHRHHARYRGIFDVLDNAIRLRNEAAHGLIGQRITLRDVQTYRIIIYRLVPKADEYLETRGGPVAVAGVPAGAASEPVEVENSPSQASAEQTLAGGVPAEAPSVPAQIPDSPAETSAEPAGVADELAEAAPAPSDLPDPPSQAGPQLTETDDER